MFTRFFTLCTERSEQENVLFSSVFFSLDRSSLLAISSFFHFHFTFLLLCLLLAALLSHPTSQCLLHSFLDFFIHSFNSFITFIFPSFYNSSSLPLSLHPFPHSLSLLTPTFRPPFHSFTASISPPPPPPTLFPSLTSCIPSPLHHSYFPSFLHTLASFLLPSLPSSLPPPPPPPQTIPLFLSSSIPPQSTLPPSSPLSPFPPLSVLPLFTHFLPIFLPLPSFLPYGRVPT